MTEMSAATHNRRGRPATASPDDVLQAATGQYLAGQRLDLTELAKRLGMSRATIYRWFGSRESLLGEVVARQLELLVAHRRVTMREHGARGLLEVFDRINRDLARSKPLRRLLQQEPRGGMRLLTSTGGVVQPRAVACVEELIVDEVRCGRYDPPADPGTLAYAVVRLAEAFLYNDASSDIRGDYRRLREVQAALLGVPRESGPPATPFTTSS
jgi:AcrR family transcriptional regulator